MRTTQVVAAARPDWTRLLHDALCTPGVISAAYSAFWNYSTGNQLLAMFECMVRGLEPGPIHTFLGWQRVNRRVRKGERAITLCMPVSWTQKPATPPDAGDAATTNSDGQAPSVHRCFVFRPHWFVLSQTDGEPYMPLAIPQWGEELACHQMLIDREPFTHTNGNCQGYAYARRFAVSPVAFMPHRTAFHEIAHIVLGHTAESMGLSDGDERTPRDVREVEAEAVALICCKSLGLPGEEFSRGYLQHWLGSQKLEERTAHRIFHAADTILRAGRSTPADPEAESDRADSSQ